MLVCGAERAGFASRVRAFTLLRLLGPGVRRDIGGRSGFAAAGGAFVCQISTRHAHFRPDGVFRNDRVLLSPA